MDLLDCERRYIAVEEEEATEKWSDKVERYGDRCGLTFLECFGADPEPASLS